ncbi:MAG: rhomboid family intramembrane serine protease, partial [Lachnospiraceae bacterium]|nr:rhomboid family intramembrane serine protease [Lachnospiraceae bacterium]
VERALGERHFLSLYVLSAVVGGLGWMGCADPRSLCIGASGAIFGVLAAYATATEAERDQATKASLLYGKYAESYDPDSAYEFFQRLGLEQQAEEERLRAEAEKAGEEARLKKEQEKEQAKAEKDREKELAKAEKEREKAEKQKQRAKDNAIKQVGNSVFGTLGREAGKKAGSAFGSIGKKVGGNLGAAIGRGIVGTLFKK